MTVEDTLALLHPSAPAFHPSGDRIAFSVEESFSRRDEGIHTRIWIAAADGSGARELTRGPWSDAAPCWSPDGALLAFLSDRAHQGRHAVHLLEHGAGEARPVGEIAGSVEQIRFSADSSTILALAADPGSDRAGAESATRIGEAEADPKVSVPAEHWRRLYRIDVASGTTERVSPDGVNFWEFDWHGGDTVAAIVSDDPTESGWYASRLAIVELGSGSVTDIHGPRHQLERVSLSPDGRTVAVVEGFCSDRSILAGETTIAAAGQPARVLAPELDVTCLVWDGEDALWFAAQRGAGAACGRLGLDGSAQVLWEGPSSLNSGWVPAVAPSPDGSLLAAAHSSWDEPPELRVLNVTDAAPGWHAISNLNPDAAALPRPDCRRVTWTSFDGREIDGLLITPAGASGPMPTIVHVHGGPTGVHIWRFPGLLAAWAADAGYALFEPNPRGSSGYGQDFARANIGDMGGGDLKDILAGVDTLVADGVADERLGIYGGSYGGFMAAWAISQTERFRASIAAAAVTDWLSFHNTTNIGRFDELFLDADPYDPDGDYFHRSPVVHVRKVKTPTLVMHGELDLCVPLSQGQEMYRALADAGVETALVVYPREGHGWVEREHLLDGCRRMREWFDRHLGS
jgi:dipeptidyl aminopeptidase/acylaminoacyl peptidase